MVDDPAETGLENKRLADLIGRRVNDSHSLLDQQVHHQRRLGLPAGTDFVWNGAAGVLRERFD